MGNAGWPLSSSFAAAIQHDDGASPRPAPGLGLCWSITQQQQQVLCGRGASPALALPRGLQPEHKSWEIRSRQRAGRKPKEQEGWEWVRLHLQQMLSRGGKYFYFPCGLPVEFLAAGTNGK